MFVNDLEAPLEAVLFASGNPISLEQLMEVLELDRESVLELLSNLGERLNEHKSGLMLQEIAGGWQLVTRPEHMEYVKRLCKIPERKLSSAALETLAIVAFKQPVTRQEIEDIRGVKADHSVAKLCELDLISEVGRKEAIGRPVLYGTTNTFLQCFGLKCIDELQEKLPLENLSMQNEELSTVLGVMDEKVAPEVDNNE